MAGDFVMVQCATPRKPEVLRLATMLKVEPLHAFGMCVAAWMWFDEQTEDGHVFGVTNVTIDSLVGHQGFANALRDVGWLVVEDDRISVPNFERLMGESAKKRGKNRKKKQKSRCHQKVGQMSPKRGTKEEKRKEEIDTPNGVSSAADFVDLIPKELQAAGFISTWKRWVSFRTERKPKVTRTAAEQQLGDLAKWETKHGPGTAVVCIEESIRNSWQGLFEPKGARGTQGNSSYSKARASGHHQGEADPGYAIFDQPSESGA